MGKYSSVRLMQGLLLFVLSRFLGGKFSQAAAPFRYSVRYHGHRLPLRYANLPLRYPIKLSIRPFIKLVDPTTPLHHPLHINHPHPSSPFHGVAKGHPGLNLEPAGHSYPYPRGPKSGLHPGYGYTGLPAHTHSEEIVTSSGVGLPPGYPGSHEHTSSVEYVDDDVDTLTSPGYSPGLGPLVSDIQKGPTVVVNQSEKIHPISYLENHLDPASPYAQGPHSLPLDYVDEVSAYPGPRHIAGLERFVGDEKLVPVVEKGTFPVLNQSQRIHPISYLENPLSLGYPQSPYAPGLSKLPLDYVDEISPYAGHRTPSALGPQKFRIPEVRDVLDPAILAQGHPLSQFESLPPPVGHSSLPAPVSYASPLAPVNYSSLPAPVSYTSPLAPVNYSSLPAPVGYASPPAPVAYASPPAPVVYANPPAPVVYANPPAPVVYVSPPAPVAYASPPAPVGYQGPPTPVGYVSPPEPAAVEYTSPYSPSKLPLDYVDDANIYSSPRYNPLSRFAGEKVVHEIEKVPVKILTELPRKQPLSYLENLQAPENIYKSPVPPPQPISYLENLHSPVDSYKTTIPKTPYDPISLVDKLPGALGFYGHPDSKKVPYKQPIDKIIRNIKLNEFICVKKNEASLAKEIVLSPTSKSTFYFDPLLGDVKTIQVANTAERLCLHGIPKDGRRAAAVGCNDEDPLLKWDMVPIHYGQFWIQQRETNYCLQPSATLSNPLFVEMKQCDLYDPLQLWDVREDKPTDISSYDAY